MKGIFLLLPFALLMACSPKYYTPNTQNSPLFTSQGQTQITVSGNDNQVEFQGAYAMSDHAAVLLNGGLFIPKDLDNGNGGSGEFIEFGAGYFTPVGDYFVFETYGLIGFGGMENHLPASSGPTSDGEISAGVLRYGIQPGFGFQSRHVTAGVSTRIVNLSFNNIEGDLVFDGEDQVAYLEENNNHLLFEPAITVRGGLDQIKLQLQLGHSFNLTESDFRQDDTFATIGLSFGFDME